MSEGGRVVCGSDVRTNIRTTKEDTSTDKKGGIHRLNHLLRQRVLVERRADGVGVEKEEVQLRRRVLCVCVFCVCVCVCARVSSSASQRVVSGWDNDNDKRQTYGVPGRGLGAPLLHAHNGAAVMWSWLGWG